MMGVGNRETESASYARDDRNADAIHHTKNEEVCFSALIDFCALVGLASMAY